MAQVAGVGDDLPRLRSGLAGDDEVLGIGVTAEVGGRLPQERRRVSCLAG